MRGSNEGPPCRTTTRSGIELCISQRETHALSPPRFQWFILDSLCEVIVTCQTPDNGGT
jgi:hypothetical protein